MSISMLKGLHRRALGLSKDSQVIARKGFVAGGDGGPAWVYPGPDTTAIIDDFNGDTGRSANIRANTDEFWRILDGDTGTDTGSNVTVSPGTGGILRIKISETNSHTGAVVAVTNGMGVNSSLNWKGNQGSNPTDNKHGLRFACRLKASGYTDTGRSVNIWAGLTDSLALEAPVYDTGGAVQATATDAVGFWYSAGADTGWSALSVNTGGTPQAKALDNTRQALRAGAGSTNNSNTYDTLEFELHHGSSDTGGTATFYVNGVPKGSISGPVAMNVALTPQIYVWGSDTGGGMQVDVDWVNVSGPRDTGL